MRNSEFILRALDTCLPRRIAWMLRISCGPVPSRVRGSMAYSVVTGRPIAGVLAAVVLAGALALTSCLSRAGGPAPADAAGPGDLRAFLASELAAGRRRIVIPPGRYRVTPEHGRHLLFRNLRDVEIVAVKAELVCGATVQAIGFEACTNVTLRGLTVDYDPLPFTQGSITALAPDKSWVEFAVAEGYPEHELEERIEIFDPATGELRRESTRWEPTFEALGEHRYRVRKQAGYRFSDSHDTERVGDILVTNNRSPSRAGGHAVVAANCTGLRLEDVTVYASHCFGFLEHDCSGSTYLCCRVDRRAPANDPVKRAQPRMRSLNADAFHSKGAGKGPALIGCVARFQGDDCVNINGQYHYVAASHGKQVRMAVTGRLSIAAGDPVEFLPYAGDRPADAVAVAIAPAEPLTEAETAFIRALRMDAGLHERLLSGKSPCFTLTLDREVALPAGSAVCSGRRVGNGFVVKNCDFGHNRSRGILIKASRGEVTGNRITNSRMAAVLVSPEFWWLEAACSSDVVIRGNVVKGCGQAAIQVLAPGGNGRPLPAGAHRRIAVLDNRLDACPWPVIHATSTEDLTIKGNRWPAEPAPGLSWGRDGKPPVPVLVEQCEQAEVTP